MRFLDSMAKGKQQPSKKTVTLPSFDGITKAGPETTRVIIEKPDGSGFQYARRVVRGAPLENMHDRNQISLEQFQAGIKYRRLWDAANIGRNIGIDHTIEAVDTSTSDFSHDDATVEAIQEITIAQRRLGALSSRLVDYICVGGLTVNEASHTIHKPRKPELKIIKLYRAQFQTSLIELAYHWCYLADPLQQNRRKSHKAHMSDMKSSDFIDQPQSAVYHAASKNNSK